MAVVCLPVRLSVRLMMTMIMMMMIWGFVCTQRRSAARTVEVTVTRLSRLLCLAVMRNVSAAVPDHSRRTAGSVSARNYNVCASGCVIQCRIWNQEVADSNLGRGYFAPKVYSAFYRSAVGK